MNQDVTADCLCPQVTVYVDDINDNEPSFDRDSYEVSLSENSPPGMSVVTVTGHDTDLPHNTHLTYSMQGQGEG